jgi:hypothetical protein
MSTQTSAFIILFALNLLAMCMFFLFLRSRFSQKRILTELRSEVDKLVIDLGREADRDVAILESRIKNLRSLIDEADRRILVAGKESGRRTEEADILQSIGRKESRPAPVKAVQAEEPQPKREEPVRIYTRQIITRSEKQIDPYVPVQDRVVDMARKGFSAEMIAGTLSIPLGEVELILDMNSSSL